MPDKFTEKLFGKGLSWKYPAAAAAMKWPFSKSQGYVDTIRVFTKAPEKPHDASLTKGPNSEPSRTILQPLRPTRRIADIHEPNSESESATEATVSEMSQIPIVTPGYQSGSDDITQAESEAIIPQGEISPFKNWDKTTTTGYPVVQPPPMTGIGRYRRSKTASKEWVEENIRKQLGYIAPYVKDEIDEISGSSGNPGLGELYGNSHRGSSRSSGSGSKSPVEFDPFTNVNSVRGFSTVSVARIPRRNRRVVPVMRSPESLQSAFPPNLQPQLPGDQPNQPAEVNTTELIPHNAEDCPAESCAVESYGVSMPEFLEARARACEAENRPANTTAAPASAPSSMSFDSVPEEYLNSPSDADNENVAGPSGEQAREAENNPDNNIAAPASARSFASYDSVPEEYLGSHSEADKGNNAGPSDETAAHNAQASFSSSGSALYMAPYHKPLPRIEPRRRAPANEEVHDDQEVEVGRGDPENQPENGEGCIRTPHLNDYFEPSSMPYEERMRENDRLHDRMLAFLRGDLEPIQLPETDDTDDQPSEEQSQVQDHESSSQP